MSQYTPLFEAATINRLTLPNRIVMAPMTRSFCGPEGIPGADVARYYAARAAGGTGLIFTEATTIDMGAARGYLGVPGLCNDTQEAAWRTVVDAVHAAGGRIMVQLWHCGRLSHPRATGGIQPIAPSAITAAGSYTDFADPSTYDGHLTYVEPHAMTQADIDTVVEEYAHASRRAQRAGFDGVLFHSASGYLIHQFFNADSNQRQDRYGGDVAARARFACDILHASRIATSADYPLLMGLSQFAVNDFAATTWKTPQELTTTLHCMKQAGLNGLHTVGYRLNTPAFTAAADPAGHSLAWHARQLSGLPVSAAGGITYSTSVGESLMGAESQLADPIEAVQALADGTADLIAVGRAMVANPDWGDKIRSGRWRELVPFTREMLGTLV